VYGVLLVFASLLYNIYSFFFSPAFNAMIEEARSELHLIKDRLFDSFWKFYYEYVYFHKIIFYFSFLVFFFKYFSI